MNYDIMTTYFNRIEDNHTLKESWSDMNLMSFKNRLAECLDLLVDYNNDNNAIKPNLDTLKDSLKAYCSDECIMKEYDRLLKMYDIYTNIVTCINKVGTHYFNIDDSTNISIKCY